MRPAFILTGPTDAAAAVAAHAPGTKAGLRARLRDAAEAVAVLGREWTELAGSASEPNCYAEHWFIAASLPAFAAERDVRVVEVRRGLKLIGLMPVAVEHQYGRTRVRFVQNWCHHQLFLGTPLIRAGEEEAFWSGLLDLFDDADWAPNFLHLRGLVEGGPVHRGLEAAAVARGRVCATVHREARALLESRLGSADYYEQTIRPKKRKEIRRLRTRLAELGEARARRLDSAGELAAWCDSFLALEKSGWKGEAGSALACDPRGETFFRESVAGAWRAGRLDFLRLDLDGRAIAMLVNFLAPPGGFSFKTAFDEAYARFSPGVLIQLENLNVLDREDIQWMDSCAAKDHPMIDGLWRGRRRIVRVTVRLAGWRRTAAFAACRALEVGLGTVRRIAGRAR